MQLLFTEIDEIKNAETICSCSNRSLCTALRDVKSMFEVLGSIWVSDGQVPIRNTYKCPLLPDSRLFTWAGYPVNKIYGSYSILANMLSTN